MGKPAAGKTLFTAKSICGYLGGMSRMTFRRWVDRGMPAVLVDGVWVAHTDNLDEFFRTLTNAPGFIEELPKSAE